MKLFLKFIIEIVSITFVIAYGIQYLSDRGYRNLENSKYNDWVRILNGKINSDIIINGSSRGFVGYNPEIIGNKLGLNSFNISFNAGAYNLQECKFDIYLNKNKKPGIVIQNIDLAHFVKSVQLPDEEQFYPVIYDENINSLTTKFHNRFRLLKIIPLLKYNQKIKMLEGGIIANFSNHLSKNTKTIKGYCPQQREFKKDNQNLKRNSSLASKAKNKHEIMLLHDMVKFYNSRLDKDAKIIFVWMPEYKLRLTKGFDLKRQSIIDELNLIQKNNKNFLFINMAYDEMSNHKEYYYDTFHLNEAGSNLFSIKLAMKINESLN